MDPSKVQLPAGEVVDDTEVMQRELEEDSDGDEEVEEYIDPQEAFDDFLLTLTRDQCKMLSVLYESFR